MGMKFDKWIDELRESVIEGEYGYEPGEFTVYPQEWRPMFYEGLTPQQAFKRALDAYADARKTDDESRAANWRRIQAEDARHHTVRS
jgi:hypothetical protein